MRRSSTSRPTYGRAQHRRAQPVADAGQRGPQGKSANSIAPMSVSYGLHRFAGRRDRPQLEADPARQRRPGTRPCYEDRQIDSMSPQPPITTRVNLEGFAHLRDGRGSTEGEKPTSQHEALACAHLDPGNKATRPLNDFLSKCVLLRGPVPLELQNGVPQHQGRDACGHLVLHAWRLGPVRGTDKLETGVSRSKPGTAAALVAS